MAFKFSLVSDVRQFLAGTKSVEDALDDVSDSLDDLARDSAQDADKAADELERKFSDAFDKVRDDAKTAGKSIGDGLDDGTRKASEGTDALKENAASNAKEMAASFDGSADGIADAFQGLAAEAFEGFGPAGIAAGVAAGAGLGIASAALQQAAEDAQEAVENTHDLADALRDTGSAASEVADSMKDIVDEKQWFEYWQNMPVDRLHAYADAVRLAGVSWDDMRLAAMGNEDALNRVNQQLETAKNTTKDFYDLQTLTTAKDAIDKQAEAYRNATEWNKAYASSGIEAQQQVEEAQQHAADVAQNWADSLNEHTNVAAEGLDQFVKKGVLNLDKWAQEVKRRTREVARIEDFKVDVFPKLSPEAQQAFAELPAETQAQIAKAYAKRGKKGQAKIEATLEAQVKVDPDVSQTKVDPVAIPTTIDTSLAAQQAAEAATAAQREADRSSNVIEIKTRIDRDELQRQATRAAASITPPTITVKTRVKREAP